MTDERRLDELLGRVLSLPEMVGELNEGGRSLIRRNDVIDVIDATRAALPQPATEPALDKHGWAADHPNGPRTERGHVLASRLRRWDQADVDWDAWVRDIEDQAVALAAQPSAEVERLRELLREAIEEAHAYGLVSHHHDPTDKTGWNVKGIETCGYALCVQSLAALAESDR